jgi:predicted nucleic acid-binding protein
MGQIIGIDTQIFTYVMENNRQFEAASFKIIQDVENGKYSGIFASIGIIELLTGPKKSGKYDLARQYQERLEKYPNLVIRNLNESIIDIASTLRAKYNLRTPDSIHLATAIDARASVFFTNDKKLKVVREIKVVTL